MIWNLKGKFHTDKNGVIDISTEKLQSLISTASNSQKSAFVLSEYETYNLNIECDTFSENITIDSGIGTVIEKEEWRDGFNGGVVGNLFYPMKKSDKNKAILHLNGGVSLLQDGR